MRRTLLPVLLVYAAATIGSSIVPQNVGRGVVVWVHLLQLCVLAGLYEEEFEPGAVGVQSDRTGRIAAADSALANVEPLVTTEVVGLDQAERRSVLAWLGCPCGVCVHVACSNEESPVCNEAEPGSGFDDSNVKRGAPSWGIEANRLRTDADFSRPRSAGGRTGRWGYDTFLVGLSALGRRCCDVFRVAQARANFDPGLLTRTAPDRTGAATAQRKAKPPPHRVQRRHDPGLSLDGAGMEGTENGCHPAATKLKSWPCQAEPQAISFKASSSARALIWAPCERWSGSAGK